MVNQHQRRRDVIVRMLIGGVLLLLSLPVLSPLIVGTLITRAIYGVYLTVKRITSDRPGEN